MKKQKIQTLMTRLNKIILYYYIFYKHFYKFIFLHKPLCPKYKESTLKIFGLYICRSCLLLYSGFIISLILTTISVKTVYFDKYFFLGLCGCILTFGISYPAIYSRFSRITKDFIRFYDGIFLAAFIVMCFKISIIAGIVAIGSFIIMRNLYNKRRGGEKVCKDCDALIDGTTCIGYIQQKQALLKIEEEYSKIITEQRMKNEMKGV